MYINKEDEVMSGTIYVVYMIIQLKNENFIEI